MNVIVLAAGDAQRHGNKLLLPTKTGRTCIELVISEATCLYNQEPWVVVKPHSAVHYYLRRIGHSNFFFQPNATGVMDAILTSGWDGDTTIFFGDTFGNVLALDRNRASTVKKPDPTGLYAKWVSDCWVDPKVQTSDAMNFLGHVRLNLDQVGSTLIETMNLSDVRPVNIDTGVDFGSEAAFMEYWK